MNILASGGQTLVSMQVYKCGNVSEGSRYLNWLERKYDGPAKGDCQSDGWEDCRDDRWWRLFQRHQGKNAMSLCHHVIIPPCWHLVRVLYMDPHLGYRTQQMGPNDPIRGSIWHDPRVHPTRPASSQDPTCGSTRHDRGSIRPARRGSI